MAWECPHLDQSDDNCRRLKQPCVPGRKGCTLPKNLKFAVPPEVRVAEVNTPAIKPDTDASSH